MTATDIILLVGGLGTRLRAVVSDLPKPMAPVAGRPFLEYLLDAYARAGMRRAILATGYRSEAIEAAIGTRWQGMEILYSREEEPLGTGGAVRQAASHVLGKGVHLANGDTFLCYEPAALEAAARGMNAHMGVALAQVDDVGRYGAVEVQDGRITSFHEKGGSGAGLINAGSYFITEQGLSAVPDERAYSFEERVLLPWVRRGEVVALSQTSGFIDIGVPEDYARAQILFGGMNDSRA